MLRILLIAPGLGLNTTPEVRDMSRTHRVTILNDRVTARDVYSEARGGYDVLHFASHSDEQQVQLSEGFLLDTDLLQLARSSKAKLIYFNSCHAGRLAHYLVGHGVALAIHTNTDLNDDDAWKMPQAFYGAVESLGNTIPLNYVRAFQQASDGEGEYGLAIAPDLAAGWAMMAAAKVAEVQHPKLNRWQWGGVAAVAVLTLWLLALTIAPLLGGVP